MVFGKKPSFFHVKIVSLLFVAVLVSSLGTYFFSVNLNSSTVYGKPHFFEVVISPDSAKLGVNQTQTFVVAASGGVEPYEFFWSVTNATGPYLDCFVFESLGNQANFTFTKATEDVYRVSVKVVDAIGATMTTDVVVVDPYTGPDTYCNIAYDYSYLIETDGLGWFRWVTNNGAVVTNSNFTAFLINLVGNASAGDTIFVKNGEYEEVSGKVTVNKALTFVGEDWQDTVINFGSAGEFSITAEHVTFMNMYLKGDGTGATKPLIHNNDMGDASRFGWLHLEKLYISNHANENVYILDFKNAERTIMHRCNIRNTNSVDYWQYGALVRFRTQAYSSGVSFITDNEFWCQITPDTVDPDVNQVSALLFEIASDGSSDFGGGCERNHFAGYSETYFETYGVQAINLGSGYDNLGVTMIENNCENTRMFWGYSVGTGYIKLIAHDNTVDQTRTSSDRPCVKLDAYTRDSEVFDNYFRGGSGVLIVDEKVYAPQANVIRDNFMLDKTIVYTAGTIIRDNRGFLTESSGTSTGTGSQQTIAHGLGVTPNRVCFSEYTTGGAGAYLSASADDTNIYVTAVSGKTYVWEAWRDPLN